jgi:hypothetical protein
MATMIEGGWVGGLEWHLSFAAPLQGTMTPPSPDDVAALRI